MDDTRAYRRPGSRTCDSRRSRRAAVLACAGSAMGLVAASVTTRMVCRRQAPTMASQVASAAEVSGEAGRVVVDVASWQQRLTGELDGIDEDTDAMLSRLDALEASVDETRDELAREAAEEAAAQEATETPAVAAQDSPATTTDADAEAERTRAAEAEYDERERALLAAAGTSTLDDDLAIWREAFEREWSWDEVGYGETGDAPASRPWVADATYVSRTLAKAAAAGSDTDWLLAVDCDLCRLLVWQRDGSSWSLVRGWECLVGEKTRPDGRSQSVEWFTDVIHQKWEHAGRGMDVHPWMLSISGPQNGFGIHGTWSTLDPRRDENGRPWCTAGGIVTERDVAHWLWDNVDVGTRVHTFDVQGT